MRWRRHPSRFLFESAEIIKAPTESISARNRQHGKSERELTTISGVRRRFEAPLAWLLRRVLRRNHRGRVWQVVGNHAASARELLGLDPAYFTTGDSDFLLISEANDAENIIAALMAAAAAGTISDVTTARAWTGAEFKVIGDKASKAASAYRVPGKRK